MRPAEIFPTSRLSQNRRLTLSYTVTHTVLYIVFKHCLFILSLYIVLIHCPYTLSHTLSCTLSYTLSQAVLYSSEQNTVATLYIISNSVFSCKDQILCTAVEIHWQVLLLQKGIRGFFSVRNSYAFKNMWKLSLRKLGALLYTQFEYLSIRELDIIQSTLTLTNNRREEFSSQACGTLVVLTSFCLLCWQMILYCCVDIILLRLADQLSDRDTCSALTDASGSEEGPRRET